MAETAKIYKAISNVMKDCGVVGKNDTNKFDNYKFRGIDAVMNALNPAMIKNGIFVVPTVLNTEREERVGSSKGTVLMYTVLTVKYTFYADDGSSVESIVIGEAMDRSDKSTNKAMSAAFKYACFQTFCIPTEEMHDSEEDSEEIGKKVVKQPKETPKEAPKEAPKKETPKIKPPITDQVVEGAYPDEDTMREACKAYFDGDNLNKMLKWAGVGTIDDLTGAKLVTAYGKASK